MGSSVKGSTAVEQKEEKKGGYFFWMVKKQSGVTWNRRSKQKQKKKERGINWVKNRGQFGRVSRKRTQTWTDKHGLGARTGHAVSAGQCRDTLMDVFLQAWVIFFTQIWQTALRALRCYSKKLCKTWRHRRKKKNQTHNLLFTALNPAHHMLLSTYFSLFRCYSIHLSIPLSIISQFYLTLHVCFQLSGNSKTAVNFLLHWSWHFSVFTAGRDAFLFFPVHFHF